MGMYDGLQEIGPTTPPPAHPKPPAGLYDGLPVLGGSQTPPRTASGAVESLQAGFQASAPGLAWRGKLPDLVMNPEHASWWERALSGVAQVGAELPLMVAGAVAGAPAGAAIGTAIAPGLGTAAGSLLGAGAGMGIVPGAIRESLMQAYKSGEIKTGADWWAAIKEVAATAGKEGAINAAAMGAGAVAARAVGSAIAPKIGQTMTQAAGIRTIVGADLATQIAAMPTIPAALQGRLPDAQEFLDAAILIGGLHLAGTTAAKIANTYMRTGKTPAEVVADAQANPEIATELAKTPDPQDVYVPPSRAEMLTIQENLFTESARLGEMEAKAAAAPLTDAERLDFNALKSRVLDLERQLDRATPADEPAAPASYTADQFVDARNQAEKRAAELAAKGDAGNLTDAERAERVFLANSKDKPEALAAHFKLEPQAPRRITAEQFDTSAQRVHDAVLRQVKAADEARRASGLTPLGDDHAAAIAALVRARLRTRAQRLGMLPEDLYNERPVRIEDETAPEVAAAEAAIPADAPRFTPPEVDLFGDPVVVTNAPRYAVENKATVELPLANLILSKEVPQFKHAADQQGVVVPLGGRFDRTGVGPIQVWERRDGTLEVISGRHRLDLARRSVEETIPAQVHREADGFDARQAATLDAELNIREEQGSVADYAQYFKDSGKTREAADELGLLARAKGRAGFAIARDASPDLLAAHRASQLSDEAALAISSTAPGSARLQALGIAMVNEGKSILIAVNTMRAMDLQAAERMMAGEQGDIFGFDDSAMREASTMAKRATAMQRKISEQISAVSGASKRPELAAKMGVNVEDPAAVQLKIVELRQEQYLWDNWPLYPELVARLRGETMKQDEFPLLPETPAEGAARDREAAAEAVRKIEGDTPTKLFQDLRDTWYKSALGEAVQGANIKSAPAKAWQDFLKGQVAKGGVKADEIKWSGVEEWLQLQEGKVTKEQVADYLATNGVKVEEVMTGGKTTPNLSDPQIAGEMATLKEAGWLVDQDPDGGSRIGFFDPDGDIVDAADLRDLVRDDPVLAPIARAAENIEAYWYGMQQGETPTKFSQYQLPGGQNYRELLLTLPTRNNHAELRRQLGEINARMADINLPQSEFNALAQQKDSILEVLTTKDTKAFTSSHFDTPNILAHIRFNERTDAEGKKVLFIEEFQSDWAQQGKKRGFQGQRQDSTGWTAKKPADGYARDWEVYNAAGDLIHNVTADTAEGAIAAAAEGGAMRGERVPAAPFVGKTDAWVSLAMKRMIAYAAQNGFDRVAWTRGEQQVERYTSALRKQVDTIEWNKTKDGIQLVGYKGQQKEDPGDRNIMRQLTTDANAAIRANDNFGFDSVEEARAALLAHNDWQQRWEVENGEHADAINDWRVAVPKMLETRKKVVDTTEKEDALSDAIGKAMAEKIINDPNQSGTIEGDNIKIDSTGMAGFYDKIVPKVANEVLKKLGGEKVGQVDIAKTPGQKVNAKELADEALAYMRGEISPEEFRENTGLDISDAQLDEAIGGYNERNARQRSIAVAFAADQKKLNAPGKQMVQQSFEITPALRDKAMQGLPLFQQHRGSYDVAENLITIMQGADKSTVVHELGHSWLEEMKIDAKREGVPDQIRQDWEVLRRELAIGEDGTISRASHEQFARSVERYLADGDAPSIELRSVFQRFKEWLLEIYRDLANLNVNINPELRAVLDRMLATDEQIKAAREMDIPVAYVPEALEIRAAEIVPPPAARRKIEPGFKAEQLSMEPYADELPPGPGEAPDNTHVNYAYINSPMDVKLAMQRMAEIDQANIQAQRGGTDGVKSWAEANAEQARYLNDILGGGPDTLHLFEPRDPEAPHVDVRLGILKKLAVGAAKDSARLRDVVLQKGHDATVREQLEYLGSIERARMIQAEFLGERASIARALNALKDTTEGTGEIGRMLEAIGTGDEGKLFQAARTPEQEQAYLKAKLDEIMIQYRGKSVLDIAKLHKEIGTLKGSFKFADEVTKASKWEMIVEGWKSALLSGPVTHTTNLFGTGAFQVMRAPVDALAVIIGTARGASPGMGESNRASMSEITARLTGMLGGTMDGLKMAYATFRQDEATMKTESHREAIPGRAGEIIRIPLRFMGAEDALIGTMYERGELRTLAIRTAFDEQLNPGTREFAARVDQLIDHPTEAMADTAAGARERMTFNAPLGEKGVALQLFVGKWNLQWMIPFIRTPINIAKELARMSPFAPIVGEWRADIAKGGVARDRAIAEIGLGTAIMGVTMAYAFAGNISGGGSPDPGKNRGKAGVWQPYSVLVGDTWYEYARIQPTGTLMGLAADIAVAWDHMTEEEKDKVPKLLAGAFAQAVTNQTFLQGITNFINATSDPTRFAPRFFQQLAGSMVPNVIGQPTTMADPFVREVNGMLDAIQARIPGMRQDLLPKRDWLGEPVPTKERLGVVMPSRMQQVSDDKVRLEAARLDISMAAAPKKTHIGKGTGKLGDVKLTPEEMDKFEQVGGQFAHGILANIVNAPGYDQIPDLVKRRIFSKVLTASHKLAAVQALPMEKRIALIQTISEKVAAELTPEEQ